MFGAPWWLLGTLAGAGPIIIHLLNRQRFKRVLWAAMEWLLKALERNRRRMRVENLILLLIRVLILVLLALALSRPVLDTRGALAVAGGSRVCRIFVLDNSYSMGVKGEAGTPLDRAKKAIGEILDGATGGDLGTLVVTGAESAEIIPEPTTNLSDVRERLDTTELSHTDADLRTILTKVAKRAGKLSFPRIMVYVLTDLQKQNWLGEAETDDGALAKALEKIKKTTGVFLVDCAGGESSNTAVKRLVVSADETGEAQGLVAVNVPVTVRATLEHFAPDARGALEVKMLIDGQVEKTVQVTLEAREPVVAQFTNVKFDKPGPHVVRVEADADALRLDDTRELAVDVDETVKVLCVNGSPSTDLVANETYFLERALAPHEFEFAPGVSVFSVKTVSEVDFVTEDLGDYRLVMLANVFQVPEAKLKQLEHFVKIGGGLVVFLGDRVEADAYNRTLHADGKGLLGARILERKSFPSIGGEHARFVARDSEHEVMVALADRNVDVGVARVREYFYLDADDDPKNVSVLFRYDNRDGTPAAVEKKFGQGTVILVSTAATRRWSTFPVTPSFAPFVQEVSSYAARGAAARRNLKVGEPIVVRLLSSEFGTNVSVTNPNKEILEHQPEEDTEGYVLKFDKTLVSGMYTVDYDSEKPKAEYCVMLDTRESDLRRMTQGELEEALGPEAFVFVDDPGDLRAAAAEAESGTSIWKTLVYSVLTLMLLEALLAKVFGSRRGKLRG